jgi:hypothetical protein
VAAVKGMADANVTAGGLVLPGHKLQLDLELVCVRVAGVGGLEDGPVVAAAGHEQLGGVVDLGELQVLVEWLTSVRTLKTYLATDNSTDAVGDMVDDTVDQRQVVRRHTDGPNEEMPVTAARLEQVHVLVVHLGPGGILDLSTERVGNVVSKRLGGNSACRAHGGPGEQGRNGSPVHHFAG